MDILYLFIEIIEKLVVDIIIKTSQEKKVDEKIHQTDPNSPKGL